MLTLHSVRSNIAVSEAVVSNKILRKALLISRPTYTSPGFRVFKGPKCARDFCFGLLFTLSGNFLLLLFPFRGFLLGKNNLLSLNALSWVFWRFEMVLRVLRTTSRGDRRCSSPPNCLRWGTWFTSLFLVFLPSPTSTGSVPSEMWRENRSKF